MPTHIALLSAIQPKPPHRHRHNRYLLWNLILMSCYALLLAWIALGPLAI